jgi:hypothetical protein
MKIATLQITEAAGSSTVLSAPPRKNKKASSSFVAIIAS